jgi:hypothetical protein
MFLSHQLHSFTVGSIYLDCCTTHNKPLSLRDLLLQNNMGFFKDFLSNFGRQAVDLDTRGHGCQLLQHRFTPGMSIAYVYPPNQARFAVAKACAWSSADGGRQTVADGGRVPRSKIILLKEWIRATVSTERGRGEKEVWSEGDEILDRHSKVHYCPRAAHSRETDLAKPLLLIYTQSACPCYLQPPVSQVT